MKAFLRYGLPVVISAASFSPAMADALFLDNN